MTRFKILSAAAILASVLASPAMAQPAANQRQVYPDQAYRDNDNWQNSYNRWDDQPIGGEEYARRNGFVCIPGTLFRGEDGRRHLCQ